MLRLVCQKIGGVLEMQNVNTMVSFPYIPFGSQKISLFQSPTFHQLFPPVVSESVGYHRIKDRRLCCMPMLYLLRGVRCLPLCKKIVFFSLALYFYPSPMHPSSNQDFSINNLRYFLCYFPSILMERGETHEK